MAFEFRRTTAKNADYPACEVEQRENVRALAK